MFEQPPSSPLSPQERKLHGQPRKQLQHQDSLSPTPSVDGSSRSSLSPQEGLTPGEQRSRRKSSKIVNNNNGAVGIAHSYYAFPPDQDFNVTKPMDATMSETRKILVQACYLSIAAILGAAVRMILAQLFGEECANPGSVGWLSSGGALCVTRDGEGSRAGGVVFADLPANMLGSFLMGLLQDGKVLELAIPMCIAWLRPDHPFQRMTTLHTALKTGFCGSLTTFSSWNSEMVVILFGTGAAAGDGYGHGRATRIWDALFGYIVGMEVSLGSYVCGKSVARRLHRSVNPTLSAEADAMYVPRSQGVYMNSSLPDFERRFLHHVNDIGENFKEQHIPMNHVDCLSRWRSSTADVRRVGKPLLPRLIEIENAVLVRREAIPQRAEQIARAEGWDIDALREWVEVKSKKATIDSTSLLQLASPPHKSKEPVANESRPTSDSQSTATAASAYNKWFTMPYAATIFIIVMGLLLSGLFLLVEEEAYTITYRFMLYGMILSPTGALARWQLSKLNSKEKKMELILPSILSPEDTSSDASSVATASNAATATTDGTTVVSSCSSWRKWFPLGTFVANIIGCIISISAVAIEYQLESKYGIENFWIVGTIRAIKVGFAGCLTTVSTFVSEVSSFMENNYDGRNGGHAYPYIITTLGTSCILSIFFYAIVLTSI